MQKLGLSYARISGATDERTASLESQEEANIAKLESLGYAVPAEYRFRERWSGVESIYERQILIHCRELIAAGKVQAMGVYDTDRLARDPRQLDAVVADVVMRGAEMVFAQLDLDPSTRIGQLILQVKGFASIVEIDSLKDRTSRGRAKKYQAGVHAGYGRCRYGYRRDPKTGDRSMDPETSRVVVRIFEWLADGVPPSTVCRILNGESIPTPFGKDNWTTSTIQVIVREATYYGHCVGRRTMSTGIKRANGTVRQVARPEGQRVILANAGFPPIVGRELWERANAGLGAAAKGPRPRSGKTSSLFLLAGMLRCGCGFRMTQEFRSHRTGKSRCYRCTGGAPSRANTGNGCRTTRGAEKLEREVWQRVVAFIKSDEAIERECRRLVSDGREQIMRRDLETAEAKRRKVDKEAAKLVTLMMKHGDSAVMMTALDARKLELDDDARRLDAHAADLRDQLAPYARAAETAADFARRVKAIREAIDNCEKLEEKRVVLAGLGISVVSNGADILITVDARYACGQTRNIVYNTPSLPTGEILAVSL